MTEAGQPHSAGYMGPQRDLFWNRDHVELLGRRFALGEVRSVLDLGCGQGHWGRLLDTVTAADAQTVGVDMEAEWVAEATRQAAAAGLSARFRYEPGMVESLRFADGSFDLVTCQTVLIHVADPPAVIAEMVRVTKPGGLVLVAEPNNRAGMLVELVPADDFSSDAILDRLAFYLTCARGKVALGQGDDSVGDRIPGYFAAAGLETVQTFLSDRPWPLVPPYASEAQRSLTSLLRREAETATWMGWSRGRARELYLAGGGREPDFAPAWDERLREVQVMSAALQQHRLHTAGGAIHYIVGGRRPRPRPPIVNPDLTSPGSEEVW